MSKKNILTDYALLVLYIHYVLFDSLFNYSCPICS